MMTSGLASISNTWQAGRYAYRTSKAALNMSTIHMAHDLPRHKIAVVSINPGWVRTDMGGPDADIDTNESVKGMLQVIHSLKLQDTGHFYDYTGETIPW